MAGEASIEDVTEAPPSLRAGDVVRERYLIERLVGTGGAGAVFAARDLLSGRRVAVKILRAAAQNDRDLVGRFVREAATAARLRSDHVARVLDASTLPSGVPFIVFEYLEGSDLGDVLASRGRLSVAEAVTFVTQACEAVAEAHALGIVHRDIKPENLFVTPGLGGVPYVKVIDFGISKVVSPTWIGTDMSLTQSRTVMGSPRYMAPEQLRSARAADARSDLWSLGVVLYELLAGRGPFEAENLADLCVAVLKDEPEPLRAIRPDVPEQLERIVMRCLRRDPADRFASVADFARALAPLCGDAGRPATLSSIPPVTTGRASIPTPLGWNDGELQRRRGWSQKRTLSVLAVGLSAAFAWTVHANRPSSPRADGHVAAAADELSARAVVAAASLGSNSPNVPGEPPETAEPTPLSPSEAPTASPAAASPPVAAPGPTMSPVAVPPAPRSRATRAPAAAGPSYQVPLYGRD